MELKEYERHRKRQISLFDELKSGGWNDRYQELTGNLLPRRGRFEVSETGRLNKDRWSNILDQRGCRAHRILSSGLMTSKSSKAKPWFRLKIPDKDMMEYWPVREWLHQMTNLFQDIFSRSNTYRAFQNVYDEMTGFGTGPALIDNHFNNLLHWTPLTAGQYGMSVDHLGDVNTLYRRFDMKVHQVVGQFGLDNVSENTKSMYLRGEYDKMVTVIHGICPRMERDIRKTDALNMPLESVYYEQGADTAADKPLRVSGYKRFPGIAPRWDVLGNDTYGISPAMYALGAIKQLQHEHRSKGTAIDYMVKPPLQYPTALRGQAQKAIPGGIVYADQIGNNGGIKSLFDVRLDLSHLLADIQDVRQQIDEAFYVDLFLMMQNIQAAGHTAREIAERHEEKLLMLGAVDMRMDYEMFDKAIDLTFDKIAEARTAGGQPLMPEVPPELNGMELQIEYVSVLSQAQKLVGVEAIERTLGVVANVSAIKQDVVDKIDGDQIVDLVSDMFGVDPSVIVADDKVALIREGRNQQAQAAQAGAQMAGTAGTMKDMAAAGKDLASASDQSLTELMDNVPGFSQPGA